jgi:hypothetical protein
MTCLAFASFPLAPFITFTPFIPFAFIASTTFVASRPSTITAASSATFALDSSSLKDHPSSRPSSNSKGKQLMLLPAVVGFDIAKHCWRVITAYFIDSLGSFVRHSVADLHQLNCRFGPLGECC